MYFIMYKQKGHQLLLFSPYACLHSICLPVAADLTQKLGGHNNLAR